MNWKNFHNDFMANNNKQIFNVPPDNRIKDYKGAFNRMTQGCYNDALGRGSIHEKYFGEKFFKDLNKKEQQDRDLTLLLIQKSVKSHKLKIKIPDKAVNGYNILNCDKNDLLFNQHNTRAMFLSPEYIDYKKNL